MAQEECEIGAAEHEWGDFFFEALHTSPVKTEVEWDLKVMQAHVLFAEAKCVPNLLFPKVDLSAELVVEQTEVDAEADAGKHHFGLKTGSVAYGLGHGDQVLLKIEVSDIGTGNSGDAELSISGV